MNERSNLITENFSYRGDRGCLEPLEMATITIHTDQNKNKKI